MTEPGVEIRCPAHSKMEFGRKEKCMRITDLPLIGEVREEYLRYRQNGKSRKEAVEALERDYHNELTLGVEDDGSLFWVGLADGQYYRKELSQEVADKAINALSAISTYEWDVCTGDISRRLEKYKQAPMPERKVGKPRPKFRCSWAVGDTYAYRLSGQEAEEVGLAEKYVLFRKVSEAEGWDGRVFPVVTVTLWDREPFPRDVEEFSKRPLMILQKGGRNLSPKDHFEYRAAILIDSIKQYRAWPVQYLGNFSDVPLPENEIVFEDLGDMTMVLLEKLDYHLCLRYKHFDSVLRKKF